MAVANDTVVISGPIPRDLANAISNAIVAAQERGMEVDEADGSR